jgi:hypothetical protein
MRLRKDWVWMLVGLVNLPAFLFLGQGLYVLIYRSVLRHNPAAAPWMGYLTVVALWAWPFMWMISIYMGWALNPQVEKQYRGWTWLVIATALFSFLLGAKLVSPIA